MQPHEARRARSGLQCTRPGHGHGVVGHLGRRRSRDCCLHVATPTPLAAAFASKDQV